MRKATESDLVRAALDLLRLRGVFAFRVNNTGIYDARRKAFRTFHGMPGVSDLIGLVLPLGRFLAVECKVGRNRPTPAQECFLAAVRDAGGLAICAYSLEELDEFLAENGV